jgi:hypothetical protein
MPANRWSRKQCPPCKGAQAAKASAAPARSERPRVGQASLQKRWGVLLRRRPRGSLSCVPRASARSPAPSPPFSACRRTVRLGRGGVDHLNVVGARFRQGGEQPSPMPLDAPASETVVNRRWRAIDCRRVLPATTRFQHMEYAADDPTIILPPRPGLVFRQERINRRPLPVVQPKIARHDSPSAVKFESRLSRTNQAIN